MPNTVRRPDDDRRRREAQRRRQREEAERREQIRISRDHRPHSGSAFPFKPPVNGSKCASEK